MASTVSSPSPASLTHSAVLLDRSHSSHVALSPFVPIATAPIVRSLPNLDANNSMIQGQHQPILQMITSPHVASPASIHANSAPFVQQVYCVPAAMPSPLDTVSHNMLQQPGAMATSVNYLLSPQYVQDQTGKTYMLAPPAHAATISPSSSMLNTPNGMPMRTVTAFYSNHHQNNGVSTLASSVVGAQTLGNNINTTEWANVQGNMGITQQPSVISPTSPSVMSEPVLCSRCHCITNCSTTVDNEAAQQLMPATNYLVPNQPQQIIYSPSLPAQPIASPRVPGRVRRVPRSASEIFGLHTPKPVHFSSKRHAIQSSRNVLPSHMRLVRSYSLPMDATNVTKDDDIHYQTLVGDVQRTDMSRTLSLPEGTSGTTSALLTSTLPYSTPFGKCSSPLRREEATNLNNSNTLSHPHGARRRSECLPVPEVNRLNNNNNNNNNNIVTAPPVRIRRRSEPPLPTILTAHKPLLPSKRSKTVMRMASEDNITTNNDSNKKKTEDSPSSPNVRRLGRFTLVTLPRS